MVLLLQKDTQRFSKISAAKRKSTEKIDGFSEGEHAEGWCDGQDVRDWAKSAVVTPKWQKSKVEEKGRTEFNSPFIVWLQAKETYFFICFILFYAFYMFIHYLQIYLFCTYLCIYIFMQIVTLHCKYKLFLCSLYYVFNTYIRNKSVYKCSGGFFFITYNH